MTGPNIITISFASFPPPLLALHPLNNFLICMCPSPHQMWEPEWVSVLFLVILALAIPSRLVGEYLTLLYLSIFVFRHELISWSILPDKEFEIHYGRQV